MTRWRHMASLARWRVASRVLIIVAALASSTAVGIIIWRVNCATCGEYTEYAPASDVSDEDNAKVARMWNVIRRRAKEHGRISNEDAEFLRACTRSDESLYVRRWSLACMSAQFANGITMSDQAHTMMTNIMVGALNDEVWRIRRAAVASVQEAGLLRDSAIQATVQAMADDPRPEVAARVRRIDWSKPYNGG